MFANFLISALIATLDVVNATPSCDIYHSVSNPDNCLSGDCGSCFNPGARPGVLCRGQQTGYYCSASSPSAGADMAFACMDWTFGSQAMLAAEASWNARSGEAPVYFGVGTYGTGSDPIRGLGACYKIEATGVARELLVQSINTGSDVAAKQFDLMVGDGGAGAFNVCAGGKPNATMFPGSPSCDSCAAHFSATITDLGMLIVAHCSANP